MVLPCLDDERRTLLERGVMSLLGRENELEGGRPMLEAGLPYSNPSTAFLVPYEVTLPSVDSISSSPWLPLSSMTDPSISSDSRWSTCQKLMVCIITFISYVAYFI